MKRILFLCSAIIVGMVASAQEKEIKSADKGVTYGAGTTAEGAVSLNELAPKIKEGDKYTGKIKGKVVSVCQEKGCWMKLERENGEAVMVKFKDYEFFMPKDILGKEVVLDGDISVKETSVKQLKHYAEDAGKSKEEIAKIKSPKKEMIIVAKGVLVL